MRIVMFVLAMLLIASWRWAYRMVLQSKQFRITKDMAAYIECQVLQRKSILSLCVQKQGDARTILF